MATKNVAYDTVTGQLTAIDGSPGGLAVSGQFRPDSNTAALLCPNPPTVTHSTSGTAGLVVYGYQTHGTHWTGIATNLVVTVPGNTTANPVTTVVTNGRCINDINGEGTNKLAWEWETYFSGTTLEIRWNCSYDDWAMMQIFIDDQPTTADPFYPTGAFGSTVSPNDYFTKLVFSSAGTRKVRFRWENCAMKELRTDPVGSVQATKPNKPIIAFVGTSNLSIDGGGTGAGSFTYQSIQACVWKIADALGMACAQVAQPGTGYVASGLYYGLARRINALAAINPDFIVVEGANDDNGNSYATINSAAASYYSQLNTLLPGVSVLVVGPMTTDQNTDASANRAINAAAVRAAAIAAPNVVGYVDPVGWWDSGGATQPTYANSTAYSAGAIVKYQGGTYKCITGLTTSTAYPDLAYWKIISWLHGDGGYDFPNNTGNRDLMWHQGHGHSTLLGQKHFAENFIREIVKALTPPDPYGAKTFIQQIDPAVTNPAYTGPAIWYQTNGSGTIIAKKVRA